MDLDEVGIVVDEEVAEDLPTTEKLEMGKEDNTVFIRRKIDMTLENMRMKMALLLQYGGS